MGRDEHAVFVRLVHRRLQFVECRNRLIHHFSIRLEGVHAGRCDLGVVRAVLGQVAHPRTEGVRTFRWKLSPKYRPGGQQARTLEAPFVDFLF